jgi:hypothetical protein
MADQKNERSCNHDICTCRVSEDDDYCSPHCEAADGSEMMAVVCKCGHSNCGAETPT